MNPADANEQHRQLYLYDLATIAGAILQRVQSAEDPLTWFCLKEAVDKYKGLTDISFSQQVLGLSDVSVYRTVASDLRRSGVYVSKRIGIGGKNRTTVWQDETAFNRYLALREGLNIINKTTLRDHALQLRGEP